MSNSIITVLMMFLALMVMLTIVGLISEALVATPETILGDAWCSPPETC